jgi:hypothetical protein
LISTEGRIAVLDTYASLLIPLIMFAVVWGQSFWSNLVSSFNIMFASHMAFNYSIPLSNLINDQAPDWSGFTEFLCIWVVFIVVFVILRAITGNISKLPVRFGAKFDKGWDVYGCFQVSIIMWGWVAFTMLAAPIGTESFGRMKGTQGFTPTASIAASYGRVHFQFPSQLGMGGRPFDLRTAAEARHKRAEAMGD